MDGPCLAYGAVVAVVVSALKRVPWIQENPKVVAFAFVVLAHAIEHFVTGTPTGSETARELAICIGQAFAASVATFETVLKPAGKATGVSGGNG